MLWVGMEFNYNVNYYFIDDIWKIGSFSRATDAFHQFTLTVKIFKAASWYLINLQTLGSRNICDVMYNIYCRNAVVHFQKCTKITGIYCTIMSTEMC